MMAKCTIKEASTMDNNRNDSDETGQMRRDQIERLSRLEAENARLKDEVAVLTQIARARNAADSASSETHIDP
jgi:hypothetical protein